MAENTEKVPEKKARQFDFMAMFEEAKKTAIERTKPTTEDEEADATVDRINKLYKTNKEKKNNRSSSESDSNTSSSSDDEMIGPPVPASIQDEGEDEDMIGPPVPPSIQDEREDEDMIGPPLPPSMKSSHEEKQGKSRDDDDDDGTDDEEQDDSPLKRIPSSLQISLDHGKKTVSALAFDPSGARLVTGGYDYDVKLFDFAGMDSTLKPFRTLRPCESHAIKQLHYSSTGDVILVVAGNSQAKVLDRDGIEKFECKKGDQYLADMAQTKGHAAMLNSGCFNPKVKAEFMTCSNDGTVRLWDVNDEGKKQRHVIKPRSQQGRRVVPTACTYSHDGRWIVAACQDGSIQIWDHNRPFVNVSKLLRTAHMNGSDTSSLCFSYDSKVLASRGGDDTVKLWDIRNFKEPLKVKTDLPNFFPV
ncbi:WD repeat-containing protein 70-like [Ruditapes philippinarum]|uniref:WD repeat-containing protein 70-like n=1 Tax=Ruditapes philippinarum TaxID=129788 RepID=UPI00295B1C6F|nr:WD repeat-containing protein 70-like [Ruditapes philippinarum]